MKEDVREYRRRNPGAAFLIVFSPFFFAIAISNQLEGLAYLILSLVACISPLLLGIYIWQSMLPRFTQREKLRGTSLLFLAISWHDPILFPLGKRRPFKDKPERDWRFRRGLEALLAITLSMVWLFLILTGYLAS